MSDPIMPTPAPMFDEEYERIMGEPAPLPMDPADYDRIPPADIDACDHCSGTGAEPTSSLDPQDLEPCLVCRGDGVLPDWRAAS